MQDLRLDVVQKSASIVLLPLGAGIAVVALTGGGLFEPVRLVAATVGMVVILLAVAQHRSRYRVSQSSVEVVTGFGRRVLDASEIERAVVHRTRVSAFPTLVLRDGTRLQNRFLRVWSARPSGVDMPASGGLFDRELERLVQRLNDWLRQNR